MHTSSVPTEAVSIYNQALEKSNNGDFQSALINYKKAIEIYPKFVEAYNNIGEIYSSLGQQSQAISIYQEALSISRSYRILLNLGVEFFNNKDYKSAINYFLESLSQKPDFLEGNFYTAMVYYNLKDYKLAEKYFLIVIDLDKKHLKANYLLSYIYYEEKKYKKVIYHLDNIKDIADDTIFINKYYGFCHYYLGNYDKAISYLTDALESRPEYSKFKKYLKSLTYENKMKEIGDIDKAILELEKIIMNDNPKLNELSRLSMLYIFKGENKKAEKLLLSAKDKLAS